LAENVTSEQTGRTPIVAAIHTLADHGTGPLLVSADRHSTLVVVELTTELLEQRNWPLLAKVESLMEQWREHGQVPAGLALNLIGSATVGRDMVLGQRRSAEATEFWTVVIVIVILLLIYRAPFLAMIPLLSVFLATTMALQMLAHLAEASVVTLFEGIEIYITIILYGAGVDYCLFLIARYEEERERGADWGDALERAIGRVGPAIFASAATVILGIGMMVFARFGKFHHAGIAIAFSLAVSLCVVLTFTTSLLRVAGHWAFWPRTIAGPQAAATPNHRWLSWETAGNLLLRRPGLIWIVTVILVAPFTIGGILYADDVDYDFVRRLPPDAPSIAGTKALNEHFPEGAAGTVTVLIYHPHLDFLAHDSEGQIEMSFYTDRIRQRLPQLQLADIRGWALPLGTSQAAREATAAPVAEIERGLAEALKYYVSSTGDLKGHVTRLELTMLQNPLSRQGIASLNHIDETMRSQLSGELRSARIYFLGVTADMRDLRAVTRSDEIRIQVLAVGCVFVILILLLRRVMLSVYLIASVLFSYFATLGVTILFFWSLDPVGFVGLDWKVPIFLFTILVAIGADYNIFLTSRIAEEQAEHGPIEGIRVALVRTGPIITSCGLIMAGTFASLMAGSMEDLRHLGFALAFGILMDTFVVRPILVPSFLILLERGSMLWQNLSAVVKKAGTTDNSHASSNGEDNSLQRRERQSNP
jgi:RND superfamily putative drug exporter